MKKNNIYFTDDEIDFVAIFRILWKDKILIFIVSLLFCISAYLYAYNSPPKYKEVIIIKDPGEKALEIFKDIYLKNSLHDFNYRKNKSNLEFTQEISTEFTKEFDYNILDLNNLAHFVEQSKKLDNFKEFLKKENITIKEYFNYKNNFVQITKKNDPLKKETIYSVFMLHLKYDNSFFDDYVEFIKNKVVKNFKDNLNREIEYSIKLWDMSLQLAEHANLESSLKDQSIFLDDTKFFLGTTIIKKIIEDKKKLAAELVNRQLNYNPIIYKSNSIIFSKSLTLYALVGLVVGFFLSLIIIFKKNIKIKL
jgi:LPS O-antigen subunit length determinant protein (WzzB/FepE family)